MDGLSFTWPGNHRHPLPAARILIVRAKLRVLRRRNEYEAAPRHDRPAVLFRPGDGDPARRERRELAERNPPAVLAAVEIDCAERAPRRLDGREAARVSPALVTGKCVRTGRRRRGRSTSNPFPLQASLSDPILS